MPKGGHVRLTGDESDEKDKVIAGESYQVRYLGSSELRSKHGNGKGCTDEAVREIYSRYINKASVKNLPKRELFISANCVSLYASTEHAVIFKFQTVNITFCNTSEENHSAFAFVVREGESSPFRAHVVHCESPPQANDICMSMHHAFTVRAELHQAKRVDRAGWANGLISSHQGGESATKQPRENGEQHANENDMTDSNNNFGEFACAVVLPCKPDSWNESDNVNNLVKARYPERLLNGDNGQGLLSVEKKSFAQNGAGFSLAKMLLKGDIHRGRSQSLPFEMPNPWATTNGEWGCFQSSMEDDDDFSLLARERSSSMNLLTAE